MRYRKSETVVADLRTRELERRSARGEPVSAELRRLRCRQGCHERDVVLDDGSRILYCPHCGWDFVVEGVVRTFREAGNEAAVRYYMEHSSPWMSRTPEGRWTRGR